MQSQSQSSSSVSFIAHVKRIVFAPATLAGLIFALAVFYSFSPTTSTLTHATSTNKIVFASDRDTNIQIYSMNSDGSSQTRLTNNDHNDVSPAWSPDGSKVVYASYPSDSSNEEIYTMDADGSNDVQITNDSDFNGYPKWSPDGTKIAFIHTNSSDFTSAVYIMNTDGSHQTKVADIAPAGASIAWSPDGTRLATVCDDGSNQQICTMDLDGSHKTLLTSDAKDHSSPAWSPDGDRIAYLTLLAGYISPVSVMNADGSDQTVVPNTSVDTDSVDWSPDSTTLVYSGYVTTAIQVFTINPDGSNQTALTNTGSTNFNAAWSNYTILDSDQDGINNSVENAAPNGGDANNDGIKDRKQVNVTSLVSPVTGKYVTLESNCTSTNNVTLTNAPDSHKDAAFNYPNGLLNFTLHCATSGATAMVTQYYYGLTNISLVARKYNAMAQSYQAVPGAAISQVTIGGQSVAKVVYNLTDGSTLDQDAVANSVIVDPFGLGVANVNTPNTGLGGHTDNFLLHLKPGNGIVLR